MNRGALSGLSLVPHSAGSYEFSPPRKKDKMTEAAGAGQGITGRAVRRVAANTLSLAIADIANKLLMFLFYMVAARHLGVEKFGVLSFALAFVTMLAIFTDLGLGAVAAREIARDPGVARQYVTNAVGIKLVAALIVIGMIVFLVNVLRYPAATIRVVYICSLFVFESAFVAYGGYVFQGFQRMEFTALTRLLQTGVLVGGALLLARGAAMAERYAWLYAGAGLLAALFVALVIATKFVRLGVSFDLSQWKGQLRAALSIGIANVFVVFYYWNGTALLSKLAGERAVGEFNAAFRLAMGLTFAAIAFSGALYPVMSKLFIEEKERLSQTVEQAIKLIMVILLPIGVLGTTLADPIMRLLYGTEFVSSTPVFRILVWWTFCAGFNSLLSNLSMAVNRSRNMTIQTALALAINLVLNGLLISKLGALGAAISIVAAEGVSVIFYLTLLRRVAGPVHFGRLAGLVGRAVIAVTPAAVCALLAVRIHVVVGITAGFVAYALALVATGAVGQSELMTLKAVLT
ncbi:MAG: flippase, partial [candidate division WOR-3 bacterium]